MRGTKISVAAVLTLAGLYGSAAPAWAAPILTVPSTVTTSTSGTLLVTLADSTPGQMVYGYGLEFVITPVAGAIGTVSFPAASAVTEAPSPLFADTPGFSRLSGSSVYVTDFDFSGAAPAAPPGTSNLLELNYVTTGTTLGTFNVTVFQSAGNPRDAQIQDSNAAPIAGTTFVNGSITVAASPEPASLGILCTAGALALRRPSTRRPRSNG